MYLRTVFTVDRERLVFSWYLVSGLQLNLIMVHWPNLTDKTFSTYIHYTYMYQTLESFDSSILSKPYINTGLLFFLMSSLTYFWIITIENSAFYPLIHVIGDLKLFLFEIVNFQTPQNQNNVQNERGLVLSL